MFRHPPAPSNAIVGITTRILSSGLALLGLCACQPQPTSSVTDGSSHAIIPPAPHGRANDPALTPLSDADIQLYLSVMREAASLVQHPGAADIAARKRAQADEAAAQQQQPAMEDADRRARAAMQAAMAAAQRGDVDAARAAQQSASKVLDAARARMTSSAPTPAEYAENMRVMQIDDGTADALVAEQRHIDSGRWDAIVNAVETAVPDPQAAYGSGDPLDHPYAPSDHDRKVAAVTDINRNALAPYRSEILKLVGIVRHPPRNP
jgi:hypothetical protein